MSDDKLIRDLVQMVKELADLVDTAQWGDDDEAQRATEQNEKAEDLLERAAAAGYE